MKFTDLTAAFEEMEWLVHTTNKTHGLWRDKRGGKYQIFQKGMHKPAGTLLAELNIRNVIGESLLNEQRGKNLRRVTRSDQ